MSASLRHRRGDDGQALALVLIFLVMFSVVIGLLLTQVQSSFVLNESTQSQSQLLYAADSGLEWAITQLGSAATCPSGWTGAGGPSGVSVTSPSVTGVTITCTQATGPGSNLFGGYAVVTGVGYYGHTSGEGSTTCQSISSDPPNNGSNKTTWGSGSGGCLTYPTGVVASVPSWTNDNANASPAPTQQLNDVTSPDQTDIWAVGNAASGQETIWYYDGDDFTDVTTATNTSGVTNANLNGVWAADASHVWAVGQSGDIFYCSSSCGTTSSTWVKQTTLNSAQLNEVTGFSSTNVYAVGNASGGLGTALTYNAVLGTWTALGTLPAVNKNYYGIYALDATHIWVVGQSGTILFFNGLTWVQQTAPGGTPDLKAVNGTSATSLWAVGNNFTITCTANCTAANATWVKVTNAGVANAAAVDPVDSTDVWIAGGSGGSSGVISYCTASCNTAGSTWTTTNQVPTGTGELYGLSNAVPPSGQSWTGYVWAVGVSGTVLTYAPLTSTPNILGKISGGPVFNAQGWNFASGVDVANNFTQMLTNCSSWSQPSNLVIDAGYNAACQTTIPSALQSLTEPFPTSVPAAAPATTTVTVSGVTNCPNYVVMQPGKYAGFSFSKNTTYFMESGLYYFTSGFGGIDNGNSWVTISKLNTGLTSGQSYTSLNVSALTQPAPPGDTLAINGGSQVVTVASPGAAIGATSVPVNSFKASSSWAANTTIGSDNLFIIGGQPTTGDSTYIAQASPCWPSIQASSYYTAGAGTGVTWILGGGAWMDVHTVNMEFFTREGGPASEGAMGLSIREVPTTSSTCPANASPGPYCVGTAWSTSNPGGPDQIFQVDANGHYPQVFIHGGLYTPSNNIEEFTNSAAVTLGPIDCNSLEMSFESASSPALSIEAGTGLPQLMVTATANGKGTFVEHAFWGYATNATKPSVLNWWIDSSNLK